MSKPIRVFRKPETDELLALWRKCGLVSVMDDPRADIARALSVKNCRIIVYSAPIQGSVMVGFDGYRGWLYFLAVDPDQRGRGIARDLVRAAENWLRQVGCAKVMAMAHPTNAAAPTYPALGLREESHILYGRRLSLDR